ncbi:uncharacterized protein [Amphiura filiformis]|uniref:uncharacterized protein isoform X2 n=1 Tax=Amphiura filiformis TaxID=82378 RepID=UPI003B220C1A
MDDTSAANSGNWSHGLEGGEGASFRPFGVHWLDSALQETLLPGTPWEQVEEKVSRGLIGKLRSSQEFKDMEKKQMILQLLGAKFVERYLKDELYVPNILEPPRITLLKRQQLQRTMQKFLKDKLDDVARFHDYLPGTPDGGGESSQRGEDSRQQLHSVEMRVTQEHMTSVFQKGLNRHLAMNGFTAEQARTDNIPDPSLPSMNCWSGASNLLGHSLCAILQRDPNRLSYICKRLGGKQLPASLREFLWAEMLLRHNDSTVYTEKTTEKSLRKTFAKMVSKGKLELKISKATECPISGLIKKAVQEKYDKTVCMQQYKGTSYTSQCSEALNVLYTYNRSYEPYLVHWLFPLQIAFHDIGGELEDHPYELAFYLNLLQSNTFPHWPEIYAIAEQAMARLQSGDMELYQHLQTCSTTNVKVDPKEFMVQLLEDERKKAASLSWATQQNSSSTDGLADNSKSLLANPVVFLRKWVGEGFVSVLDTQAVLLIWDQCFMSDWNRRVLEDVCLALVLLLRRDFMEATDYHQMRQVFLLTPCKLYTADIQAAFKHLQGGGAVIEVPDLDSRRLETNVPTTTPEPYNPVPIPINTAPPEADMMIKDQKLRPVCVTNINLNLVINQPDIRKMEDEDSPQLDVMDQLVNFQPERLSVSVAVLHKGRSLGDRKCENNGVMVQAPSLERGNPLNEDGYTKTYQVSFSSDSLIFDDVTLQASSYDLKFKENQAVALLTVTYRLLGGHEYLSLGWAKLPLYEYQDDNAPPDSNGTYCASLRVQLGKKTLPLFPGEAPEMISVSIADPDYEVDDHLQPGSYMTTTCIDPSDAGIPSESTSSPQPQAEEPLWVPYDSDIGERSTPWKPDQGFDLYIDQVRFLPDNATIIKVTARIVQPHDPKVADVLATPLLDSPARCPQFEYRDTTEKAEETNLVVLRVYTVDKVTKELVALGAAILPLYDEEEHLLHMAGFQLPLRSGIPDEDIPLDKAALDKLPIVPGTSILVRVLPISKIFIPAPNYASGYYRNSYQSKPTESHMTVMEHYKRQDNWVETVQDIIENMHMEDTQTSQDGEAESSPLGREAMTEWLIDRLQEDKHLPEGVTTPGDLDLTRCVNYDLSCGLHVFVRMTPGVKGTGLYTHAVCQVLPGRRAADLDITSEGYGVVDRFHTKQHKFNSLQTAPQWKDPPKHIHPHYDTQSVLFIRIIGLTLLYKPDPNQEGPGVIRGKHGKKRVQLGPESYLGWTVLPMFDKGCVAQGTYILPIFQDDTNLDFLEDIGRADNLLTWLKSNIKKKVIKINRQYATAVVSVFDGHYHVKAESVPLPKRDSFLDVDDFEKFAESAQLGKEGPQISQHILRHLPKEVQDEEMDSVLYQQEEKYFEQLALIVFDEVLEDVKEIGLK